MPRHDDQGDGNDPRGIAEEHRELLVQHHHAIRTIPVPIVYATWSGLGIFTIAIISIIIFKQTLSLPVIFGLFLIVIGVVLVNLYGPAHS